MPEEPIELDESWMIPDIPSNSEERTLALLCHLLGGLSNVIVPSNIFLPLIIWLIKKDQSRFVDDQGKEAVNFQLTMLIAHVAAVASICFTWGLLNIAIGIFGLVYGIMAGLEANKGVAYRYPLTIRFIT